MALPTPKELLKLANACRKAGIVQFKGDGIEFTLTDSRPIKSKKTNSSGKVDNSPVVSQDDWDSLSELDKIMWSSATLPDISNPET